jgi:hypothetical protein
MIFKLAALARRRHTLALAALLLSALMGCQRQPSSIVTGSVTVDGQPLAYGAISFVPTDGTGKTAGALIENGRYRVAVVSPGAKLVQVIASAPPQEQGGSLPTAPAAPPVNITLQTPGNSQSYQVVPGEQSLDVQLTISRDAQP